MRWVRGGGHEVPLLTNGNGGGGATSVTTGDQSSPLLTVARVEHGRSRLRHPKTQDPAFKGASWGQGQSVRVAVRSVRRLERAELGRIEGLDVENHIA